MRRLIIICAIAVAMPGVASASADPTPTTPTTPPPGTTNASPEPSAPPVRHCRRIGDVRAIRYSGFPRFYKCNSIYSFVRSWLRAHDREDNDGLLNMDALLHYWSCASEEVNFSSRGSALGRAVECSSGTDSNGNPDDLRIVRFIARNRIL